MLGNKPYNINTRFFQVSDAVISKLYIAKWQGDIHSMAQTMLRGFIQGPSYLSISQEFNRTFRPVEGIYGRKRGNDKCAALIVLLNQDLLVENCVVLKASFDLCSRKQRMCDIGELFARLELIE
jgi:hypothetical protein